MENFIENFIERSYFLSVSNSLESVDFKTESSVIKFLQKIIFKHDVMTEFKLTLNSVCSPEDFIVSNEIVKKVVVGLREVLVSEIDDNIKVYIFHCMFQSFVASYKGDYLTVVRFFVLLWHILGLNVWLESELSEDDDGVFLVNRKNFQSAFSVKISKPSLVSFEIIKELFMCLSKITINLNTPEMQTYYKWLLQIVKHITVSEFFKKISIEIFSSCVDIDYRLIEANADHIFSSILLRDHFEEGFVISYSRFLEKLLWLCSRMQRTVKFITKLLSVIKATPTNLTPEAILPLAFYFEFSKVITTMSTQQSLSLMEVLVLCLNEEMKTLISTPEKGSEIIVEMTSELLISFLKDVKIYASNISFATLESFFEKLNLLVNGLRQFGDFVFDNTDYIFKHENVFQSFLRVCFYCSEVELLIYIYKDSFSKSVISALTSDENEWNCCLSLKQWNSLVKMFYLSKINNCNFICVQLALQKLRMLKVEKKLPVEDSTVKLIIGQLTDPFTLRKLTVEDLITLMEFLSAKQYRSMTKKLLGELLKEEEEEGRTFWLSDSRIKENLSFVVNVFSHLLKETGSTLNAATNGRVSSKLSWLSEDHFDGNNVVEKSLDDVPEKLNSLLGNPKKVKKKLIKSLLGDAGRVRSLVKVFGLLPLSEMDPGFRKLGLIYALGICVLASGDEITTKILLDKIYAFLNSEVDASICFDVGLCLKWLSELTFDRKEVNDVRLKVMEELIRKCPNSKDGLVQIGNVINSLNAFDLSPLKLVETQVLLYHELGKCWQRAKKRKSENDLIGSYRNKLARTISEEAIKLWDRSIDSGNHRILLKIFVIELNGAVGTKKEDGEEKLESLLKAKFELYFDFAVNTLEKDFDESCISFLLIILKYIPQIRKFVPDGILKQIWTALKRYGRGNWEMFSSNSNVEEFRVILTDLFQTTKAFLRRDSKDCCEYLEIWMSFVEACSNDKLSVCVLHLQELFRHIYESGSLLFGIPTAKRISLMKFFYFCLCNNKVVLTSQMVDTILGVMVDWPEEICETAEDFHDLFVVQMEAASLVLLKQFSWNKNKVHLGFVFFKKMLDELMKRCEEGSKIREEDIVYLSACAFSMKKWVSFVIGQKKDFARIAAYFITAIVSSIVSFTVPPAIKVHLINCINHFLSISDSHTISYLSRVLKPGHQQVFNAIYDKFKKYHKYLGKI